MKSLARTAVTSLAARICSGTADGDACWVLPNHAKSPVAES
jgi:hypothetical protein